MHFLIGNNNFIEKRLLRGRIHEVAWRITIENNDIKYQLSIFANSLHCNSKGSSKIHT